MTSCNCFQPRQNRRFRQLFVAILMLCGFSFLVSAVTPPELPSNPKDWICQGSDQPAPKQQVAQFCAKRCSKIDKQGKYSECGISAILQDSDGKVLKPAPLSNLDEKNQYDIALKTFLNDKTYQKKLNWASDKNWRLTGPVVGKICNQGEKNCTSKSFGVHPAVRIYYSPEMVEWMCNDREGDIKPGAMIIKEMHDINTELGIASKQCMTIPESKNEVLTPSSWTVMVRDSQGSADGWYWANPTDWSHPDDHTKTNNPPIIGQSAVTNDNFWGSSPIQRNPHWYPTQTGGEFASIVYPYNLYGGACINCHASAEKSSTFSSLDNILTPGISYKHFNKDVVLPSPPDVKQPTLSQPLEDHQVTEAFHQLYNPYPPPNFLKKIHLIMPGHSSFPLRLTTIRWRRLIKNNKDLSLPINVRPVTMRQFRIRESPTCYCRMMSPN